MSRHPPPRVQTFPSRCPDISLISQVTNIFLYFLKKMLQNLCHFKQTHYICPRNQINDNENNFSKCMFVALLTTPKVVRKQKLVYIY